MRPLLLVSCLFLFIVSTNSCGLKAREQQLSQREAQLSAREEQLLLREKEFQLKEKEWLQKHQPADSALLQRLPLPDSLAGQWNVSMVCTETNCTGAAVGDQRKELWEVSGNDSTVIAKATQNRKLIRVYTGSFNGSTLQLSTPTSHDSTANSALMTVELNITHSRKMQGLRHIKQSDGCTTVFSVDMDKTQ